MKVFKRLILLIVLFACAVSLHAQGPITKELLEGTLTRQTVRPGGAIAPISRQINEIFYQTLSNSLLFQNYKGAPLPNLPPRSILPQNERGIDTTFRVQKGPALTDKTASAFAVEYEGHLFGITAGHVIKSTRGEPYMMLEIDGKKVTVPIRKWISGHPLNVDIAAFEIPMEVEPYVNPLPIADEPFGAFPAVSIAGFAQNTPLWLPQEVVLFVNDRQALVSSTPDKRPIGLCGSPVTRNGEVVGVYAGFTDSQKDWNEWPYLLKAVSEEPMQNVHKIMLIDQAIPLMQNLIDGTPIEGKMLKVLDIPIAWLEIEAGVWNVTLMRDGERIKTVYTGPLADPEHLEYFLDIQDGDIIAVTVKHGNGDLNIYYVDVSAGTVSVKTISNIS